MEEVIGKLDPHLQARDTEKCSAFAVILITGPFLLSVWQLPSWNFYPEDDHQENVFNRELKLPIISNILYSSSIALPWYTCPPDTYVLSCQMEATRPVCMCSSETW